MVHVVRAGALYFALVFAAGFVLGVVRTLILAPRLGAVAAVAVELPVMLAVSWLAAGWAISRLAIAGRPADRLAMGAVGFVLLIAAEVALSSALGSPPAAYLASFSRPEGALGLAGQLAFALVPWIRLHATPRP